MRLKPPNIRLDTPLLLACGGLILGIGLAVWVFQAFGWNGPWSMATPEPPPQAAVPAADAAPPESPLAQLIEPLRPSAAPTATEESPFARIDEAPPEPPRRTGMVTHVVEPDEALWEIAEHYRVRSETIVWANDLDNPDLLQIGQHLIIPPTDGVMYTVRPDDRLADLVARYGVDFGSVLESNGLNDPDQIVAGADLFLPGGRPLAPAPVLVADAGGEQEAALVGAPVPLPDDMA